MTKINLLTGRLLSGGRRIPLTQGQSAIVRDSDFERINQFKWRALWNPYTKSFYAVRSVRLPSGKWATQYMHREILGLMPGDPQHVDHRDHNTLRNVRSNLRLTDKRGNSENLSNQSIYGPGVYKVSERFRACAMADGRLAHIGMFDTCEEASEAREEFLKTGATKKVRRPSPYGIGVDKVGERFRACAKVDGRNIHIGVFSTAAEACEAREDFLKCR